MIFTETSLSGAFIVDLDPREDERGFFARAWCRDEFAAQGLAIDLAQANLSFSRKRGTIRGLHYQVAPHGEAKSIRCIRGAIYDVAVDLRPESPTYEQWVGVELTSENRRMLYIPQGCAHGYQTLEDDSEALYHVSEAYAPEAERGVRWNDPAFGIAWPETAGALVSPKDAAWPDFGPQREES